MINHVPVRVIRMIFLSLGLVFLAGGTRFVFAADSLYSSQLESPVPFFHTYNLTSLHPVGKRSVGSPETGSQESLTLDECLTRALQGNPDYNISREQLRASTGDLLLAWGMYTPTMFASFGLSQSNTAFLTTNPAGNTITVGRISKASYATLGISYTWFNAGDKYVGLRNAYYLRRARQSQLRSSELTVVNDVRAAYFNVLRQEKLLEAARDQAEQLGEQLRRAEKRFKLGEVTKLDVLQAQIDLQNQELLILEYQNQVVTAKLNLDVVVGGGMGVDFNLAGDFEIPEFHFNVDKLAAEALEKHPDLENLEMQIKQQQGNLWMGRLAYLPVLRSSIGYSRNQEGLTFTPDLQRGRQVSFSATWNVLDAFLRFQANRTTQVAVNSLKYELIKTRLSIERDVRQNYLELLRLSQRNLTLAESQKMAGESLRLETRRYELGSSSMVELRKAQADYLQAKVDYINSIYDFHDALSNLSLSVGRDVSLDLE